MNSAFILILMILLPLAGGAVIPLLKLRTRRGWEIFIFSIVLLTSLVVLLGIAFLDPQRSFTLIRLNDRMNISIAFRADGLAAVFAGLIAVLWPLATCYAFEYMKHEGREKKFYAFYTITFGISIGIAFSANLLTMYLFYELLTFSTLPLVMHTMDEKSLHAGKKYLVYSLSGAAAIFTGLVFIILYGTTLDFIRGGVLTASVREEYGSLLLGVYILVFFGFGVKAAVFPLHSWLPAASAAPVTVTALLHAVAVVKAGVFAIIRVTYYSFGASFLKGTWAQYAVMMVALATILYGSMKAYRIKHFKLRLAYSTVSQLSYIIFGAALMTPAGLKASLFYMTAHALMKIVLFYCAGSVLYRTNRCYIHELAGLGHRMPITFACFTIAGLGLMGVPPASGFLGKYLLLEAVAGSGSVVAQAGLIIIFASILLTAGYIFPVIKTAFFDNEDSDRRSAGRCINDPNRYMTVPMMIIALLVVLTGIFSRPLLGFLQHAVLGGV